MSQIGEGTSRRWLRIPIERPVVTPVLLVVLAVIYIPMMLSPQINNLFIEWGANVKRVLDSTGWHGVLEGEWWRLITSTFLHGSILHILLNGYALYAIGMELEAFTGRARFAAIYAVAGLAGSVASFAFSPVNVSSVGASGAIFGLIGALGVYFGLHRQLFGKMGNAQFWNIILVIVINVGIGFSGIFPIDNSAHIGGLLAGAAMGYVLCPRYGLGDWFNPLARNLVNTNTGRLPWIAAGLIALVVVFSFFVIYLLFDKGILVPTFMLAGQGS